MYSKKNSSFSEIKTTLNRIYDLISSKNTLEKGRDLFKKLILKYINSKTLLFSLINNIQEKISSLPTTEKPPYISLLSLFFFNQSVPNPHKLYHPFLSPVLSILQTQIVDSNNEIYADITEIFGEIVQALMPNDISATNKELEQEEKELYEGLQSFCIINIKIERNINRLIGSVCLTKLVENCPYVLKNNYMKYILDNILDNISKNNFNVKSELLNCLISLILGAECLFCPYAKITLYKVLDFLTDPDWLKRKLALNVIYTLIFYCKDEIIPLKAHIINFLNVLKTDKIKEVRDVSLTILQMLEDTYTIPTLNTEVNVSSSEASLPDNSKRKNIQGIKLVNTKNNDSDKKTKNDRYKKDNKPLASSLKTSWKQYASTSVNKRKNNNSNLDNRRINKENSNITDRKTSANKRNNSSYDKRKVKELSIHNRNKERDKYKNVSKITKIERNKSVGRRMDEKGMDNYPKERVPYNKSEVLSRDLNLNNLGLRYPKYVNRTKDFSFVNEKMVIRTDPKKSIFNTNKNMAFFQQAQKFNDNVIVIPNDNKNNNQKNYNTHENFYAPKKSKLANEDERKERDRDRRENKSKLREKIDEDYDNSIKNINKLITLDAKIKKDNIYQKNNVKRDDNNYKKNNLKKEDDNIYPRSDSRRDNINNYPRSDSRRDNANNYPRSNSRRDDDNDYPKSNLRRVDDNYYPKSNLRRVDDNNYPKSNLRKVDDNVYQRSNIKRDDDNNNYPKSNLRRDDDNVYRKSNLKRSTDNIYPKSNLKRDNDDDIYRKSNLKRSTDNIYPKSNLKRDDSKDNKSERISRSRSRRNYDSKDKDNNSRGREYPRRNYSKRKENNRNEDNNTYNDNRNNVIVTDPDLVNVLLTEVRALSNKQISLIDLMDEIQSNTQQEIENLNQKIYDLDTVVKDLNHQLFYLQRNYY